MNGTVSGSATLRRPGMNPVTSSPPTRARGRLWTAEARAGSFHTKRSAQCSSSRPSSRFQSRASTVRWTTVSTWPVAASASSAARFNSATRWGWPSCIASRRQSRTSHGMNQPPIPSRTSRPSDSRSRALGIARKP
ncbi:hypothetical protein ACFFX0_10425 [Citricoccus parietis]|uniref:Uncharacterized protein n=1 Tax=Citricoccus parietis TaxID=592307 RepID=A0ABV5FY32_9MICC